MSIADRILRVKSSLPGQVELVAVSKTYPAQRIMELTKPASGFRREPASGDGSEVRGASQGHRMAPDRPFADQ